MLDSGADGVKRYAPPSQRNRGVNRRKSGDRFEKINSPYEIDAEKSRASYSTTFPAIDHGDAGRNNLQNENAHLRLIPINGCSTSEASQLLNERWIAAMHSCNDPSIDLSERPVIYTGAGGSSWSHFKLPHQAKMGVEMDFLAELRRAIHAQSSTASTAGDRS